MRLALVTILALALGGAAVAEAKAPPRMQLLSKSVTGGFPNGPSHNGVFSQDRQCASLAAFDSDASDIVRGDTNGMTDVFLVRRDADKCDLDAPPWAARGTTLASRGLDGKPANGPSSQPDLDGEQLHSPRCLAFISGASNLVRGDTNGVADAFVLNLHSGKIRRVSVGDRGQQANGATYDVKVDGHCDRVAFVSDATSLALTSTTKLSWRSAVTAAPPPGVKQVYMRMLDDRTDNSGLKGMTFLASASANGEPANADASQIAFARSGGGCGRQGRCGSFSGESVAFTSRATNLSPDDTNGNVSDVFQRSFPRRFVRLRFPRPTRVNGEVVRSTLVGVGPLKLATKVVSAAGNGPSDEPAVTDSGDYVAFRTEASNLFQGDTNGVADVLRRDMVGGGLLVVSRGEDGVLGNGNSGGPALGRTGQDLLFQSDASSLSLGDRNCTTDIYHLDIPHSQQLFTSLDSAGRVPNSLARGATGCPSVIAAPQENPRVSNYLNYALWESSYPALDIPLATKAFGNIDSTTAARMSRNNPALHQVYLRYIGPR
jgi:hypothetical protein